MVLSIWYLIMVIEEEDRTLAYVHKIFTSCTNIITVVNQLLQPLLYIFSKWVGFVILLAYVAFQDMVHQYVIQVS